MKALTVALRPLRAWKANRQRQMQTSRRGTFVPYEAFQFDWSEDGPVLGGERPHRASQL